MNAITITRNGEIWINHEAGQTFFGEVCKVGKAWVATSIDGREATATTRAAAVESMMAAQ